MTQIEMTFAALLALTAISLSGCQKAALSSAGPGAIAPPPSLSSPHANSPVPQPDPRDAQDAQDTEERRMLTLINQHRADNGLAALRIQPLLVHSARWLSQDMAARSDLSHTDSLGRDSFQRMDAFGFELDGWRGENIACGNGGADKTYLQWLYSPGHNANMLGPHYTWIGIARAFDESSQYGWYWTTDFGSG